MWRTDGTRAGTQPFDHLPEGVTLRRYWSESPATTGVGDRLFFAADDGIHGLEPWVTDGAPEGTQLFADLRPGPKGSDPQWGVAVTGYLYFAADDGSHGRQWWQLPTSDR
jgi:ELWxxDGT repeat protein